MNQDQRSARSYLNEARQLRTYMTLKWGTYGPKGDEPLTWHTLVNLSTDHLKAILVSQPISQEYKAAIITLLEIRKNIPE